MLGLLSGLLAATTVCFLREGEGGRAGRTGALELAGRSFCWGGLLVGAAVLGYLGVMRVASGEVPVPVFALAVWTGLCAVLLLGSRLELTGNVVVDALLFSAALVAACNAVVLGLPLALFWLSEERFVRLLLASVAAALVVRGVLWLGEDGKGGGAEGKDAKGNDGKGQDERRQNGKGKVNRDG